MAGPADRVGTLLVGKYRLDELLACGGMGLVYGARHQTTGRAVALKLLRPELATQTDLAGRLAAEARLAVEAAHPNVVEVLDAGADADGIPFLVLERLYGQTLEALLAEPLSLLATAQAVVPLMSALISLHGAGIVHRDVKPDNLFLSVDGEGRVTPKLLDFGIAKLLEGTSATRAGLALGTPAYMAPEQALGCRTLGAPADVWAVGVLVIRCLTGALPFEGRASSRIGTLRSGLHPDDLLGVPEPVAAALTRALRFEPSERFSSMAAFRAAWLDALAQVDPKQNWPAENSSTYSAGESELAALIQAASTKAAQSQRENLRLGRSEEVATRTLASVCRTDWASPATHTSVAWGLGLLVLLLTGFGIHSSLAHSSLPHSSLAARSSHSSPTAEVQGEAPPTFAAPASSGAPLFISSPGAPANSGSNGLSATVPDTLRATVEQPSSRASELSASHRLVTHPRAEARRAESVATEEPRPTLGANRSPIIE